MLKVAFVGGNAGSWSVDSIKAVAGDGLMPAISHASRRHEPINPLQLPL
jgi:hypothetical protein